MNPAARRALLRLRAEPAHVGVFIDFDGSLSPIVDDPAAAQPAPGALDALDRLAARLGLVAVVSGRPAAFLADRLELAARRSALRAFGLYGAEEVGADVLARPVIDARWRDRIGEVARAARLAAPDALVEDKGSAVALHWRMRPTDEPHLRALAAQLAARSGLELREGKMVVELTAPGSPDKGRVVTALGGTLAVAYVIGDDLGDAPAFDALDALEASGSLVGVRVAVRATSSPLEIIRRADVIVDSPLAAVAYLETLAEIARSNRSS